MKTVLILSAIFLRSSSLWFSTQLLTSVIPPILHEVENRRILCLLILKRLRSHCIALAAFEISRDP